MTRALFAERISFDRKESTSLERQDEALTQHAVERGVDVVGKAVDRSVSGDVDFTDRPELRQWLTDEGRARWDELWVTTQDRLSRNDIHFLAFVFKMLEWGKTLVVLDDPSLDLTTQEGRLIAHAKAMGPAKELERIKSRVLDSHQHRRMTPAWPGGVPPFGYTTVEDIYDGGGQKRVRKVLALDERMMAVAHEFRNWMVHEGLTLQEAARRLNDRGEPTVKDRWRLTTGQQPRGEKWSTSGLRRTFTSPACMGVKMHRRKPLYGRDGSPLTVADPLFTADEWETLQGAIAARGQRTHRKNGASPLLGVVFCGRCGGPAYRVVIRKNTKSGERVHRYYRCAKSHGGEKRCVGVTMHAEDAELLVEETFLYQRGNQHATERVYVPASGEATELDELDKRIARLREDRELGAYDDDPGYYAEKMREYTSARKALEGQPRTEAHWEDRELPETFSELWQTSNGERRRKLLIDAGVRLEIRSERDWTVRAYPADHPMGGTVGVADRPQCETSPR